jgi:hypothetical protein
MHCSLKLHAMIVPPGGVPLISISIVDFKNHCICVCQEWFHAMRTTECWHGCTVWQAFLLAMKSMTSWTAVV